MSEEDPAWQRAIEAKLLSFKAQLQKLERQELLRPEGPSGAYCTTLTSVTKDLVVPESAVGLRLQPDTRDAIEAAAKAVARASRSTSDALRLAAASPGEQLRVWQLIRVALHLERGAFFVLSLTESAPELLGSSPDLAKAVVLAGVAISEGASLALTHLTNPRLPGAMTLHASTLRELLLVLGRLAAQQPATWAALRGAGRTFAPAALLTCFTRIVTWQQRHYASGAPAPPLPEGVPTVMSSVCECLGRFFAAKDSFQIEHATILADEELGTALVACLAGAVEAMVEGTGPPCKVGVNALNLLSRFEDATYKRAVGGGYVRLLGRALERLLAAPVEGGADGDVYQVQALSVTLLNLESVFERADHPGLFEELLPVLATAVAAGMRLLETDGASERYELGAAALCNVLAELADRVPPDAPPHRPPGVDEALARHPLEAVRLAEALGRMSAAMRGATAGAAPLEGPLKVANALLAMAEDVMPHLQRVMAAAPRAIYLSPEGQGAVAALLASTAKVAQQLSSSWRPGTDPELYRHGQQLLPTLTSLGFMLLRVMTDDEFMAGGGEGSLSGGEAEQRRWQAVALSLGAAVTALAAKGQYQTGGATYHGAEIFSLLLNAVCALCPGVSPLVLATPAGHAAAVLAYQSFDSHEDSQTLSPLLPHPIPARLALVKMAGSARLAAMPLTLARAGALTKMVSWAEANCAPNRGLDVGGELGVLISIAALVKLSFQLNPGSGAVPPVLSMAALATQDYWRRCGEALALLAAAPAEEGRGAAEAAQLACDAAEALATRPCAHPGCATILGPSEATAPRGKRCGGCRLVRYCGAACQKGDWGPHKTACRELARRQAS